ncbi:MAG: serine hydrolase domain-containing protein [bacterium]
MDFISIIKQMKIRFELGAYSSSLYKNQNETDNPELKNLLTKKEYFSMLQEVLEIVKENNYASKLTIKDELFKRSRLSDAIANIVYVKNLIPGMNLTFGSKTLRDTILCGNKTECILDKDGNKISYFTDLELNTIYDLASTSKLLTSLAIYSLIDNNYIEKDKPVREYCPQFKNLGDTTVYDLLKFKVNVKTNERIDTQPTFKKAEEVLFSSVLSGETNLINAYTDIGAMILKYVVEAASGISFDEYITEMIFKPLGMNDTFLNVPKDKLSRVACNNFNKTVDNNGTIFENTTTFLGSSHDPKAVIMKSKENNAPGHAGYFSTNDDMMKLGNGLLEGLVISKDSLFDISKSETGMETTDKNGEKIYTKYFGSLTYGKQKDEQYLSVNPTLSGRAFMSPGFAGTTFAIDPLNHIVMFIGANRLHNRIYNIPGKFKEEKNGKIFYKGNIVSSSYALDKESIVEIAMNLAIQYQFLEVIMPSENLKNSVREL